MTAFADLPVAAYFSEYGCNTGGTRTWTEVAAIYGDSSVAQVYSGGVAFSYFPTNDAKDFGITTLNGDTVTTTAEFDNLVTALGQITTFINTPAKSAATQPPFPACPPESGSWIASTSVITFPFLKKKLIPQLIEFASSSLPPPTRRPAIVHGKLNHASSHLKLPTRPLFSLRSSRQRVLSWLALVEAATISTLMVLVASTGSSLLVTAVRSRIFVR